MDRDAAGGGDRTGHPWRGQPRDGLPDPFDRDHCGLLLDVHEEQDELLPAIPPGEIDPPAVGRRRISC